jgi:hypothetical protein
LACWRKVQDLEPAGQGIGRVVAEAIASGAERFARSDFPARCAAIPIAGAAPARIGICNRGSDPLCGGP